MAKKVYTITFDRRLKEHIDNYRKSQDFNISFSNFLETASDFYLKNKLGFSYLFKK